MRNTHKILRFLLALCLCTVLIVPTALGETADLSGKTVILYTANVRGDVFVYPKIAALRDAYVQDGANVVLADAGNYLQGSVYATYDSGKSIVELMSATGYGVAAIGSHEFDFGTGTVGVEQHEVYYADESFGKLLETASFTVTAANILTGENQDVNAYAPHVDVQSGELTLRFVGLTDPLTTQRVLESNLDGLTITNGAMPADDGVLTIALSNLGTLSPDAADVVIDIPESAGLQVGCVILDNQTQAVEAAQTLDWQGAGDNADVLAAVNTLKASVDAEYGEGTLAKATVTLNGSMADSRSMETNTGDLWTDALLWFATEGGIAQYYDQDEIDNGNTGIAVDADHIVALWNGGNLRDYVNTGDVALKDLQRVLPYPNRVAVLYLTGAQLLEQLEAATAALPYTEESSAACASFPQVAGLVYSVDATVPYDAGEAYGDNWFVANSVGRVAIESVNGNAFDPESVYAVITSNAIFNGMDAYYVSAQKDEDLSTITSAPVIDVVWMYIHRQLSGVIGEAYAAPQGRITITAE